MEKKENLFWYLEALVYAVIGVALVVTFFVRVIIVDGYSMNPTLNHKDLVLTSPVYTGADYGDIVVINSEKYGKNLIKRVIAVENQAVDIREVENGAYGVYVDGVLLEEGYIAENIDINHLGKINYPYTVPEDCIFVLGDNRNDSTDSRHLGAVEEASVVGKVIIRVMPFDNFGTVK